MRSSLALAVMLAAAAPSTLALAQTSAAAEEDPAKLLAEAQSFVNEASKLYLAQDFQGALDALLKAEPLVAKAKDPSLANIRFNIARCYEQLERWPEALAAYEGYNSLPDEAHRKQRAWEATQKLRKKVYATVSVTCFPEGSRLEIAGLTSGAVGCPWQSEAAKPGNYVVSVKHPGYLPAAKEIMVAAGQATNVSIKLDVDPASKKATGPTPEVAVQTEPSKPVRPLPWIVVGAGALLLGGGGAFHGLALGDRDDAEALPPGATRDGLVSDFELKRNLAFAFYGVGAAAVVAGIVLFFVPQDDEPDPEAVRVSPTSNGLSVVF